MEKWTELVTIDQIPEQYRTLADTIGLPQLLALAEKLGGTNIYVPKTDALVRVARDRLIRQEFNGYNTEELAKRYNLTIRWVRLICQDLPHPAQLALFSPGEDAAS